STQQKFDLFNKAPQSLQLYGLLYFLTSQHRINYIENRAFAFSAIFEIIKKFPIAMPYYV
ncbi:hypothetical protein NL329_30125, partial [Klebsiella pneumoniae]|nr:hypothetical protein [Klebsiella pneumoniae]